MSLSLLVQRYVNSDTFFVRDEVNKGCLRSPWSEHSKEIWPKTSQNPAFFYTLGSLDDRNLIIVNRKDRKSKSAIDMEWNFV